MARLQSLSGMARWGPTAALTVVVIAVFAVADVIWLPRSQIVISPENAVDLAGAAAMLAISFLVAKGVMWRLAGDPSAIASGIRHAATSVMMGMRFAILAVPLGFAGALYMYLASGAGLPLADAELARIDAFLGFDWQAFLAYCNSRPWLATVLLLAYHSLGPQVPLLIALFAALHREERLQELCALLAVASLLTAIGMVLLPAAGAYAHFAPPPEAFSSFTARAGMWHFDELQKLRSGEPFLFSSTRSGGLVTFPSYHTALGIVVAYASRGLRLVFPCLAIINAIMIVATLPEGGHYLTDVIAGAGIGGVTMLCVRQCGTLTAKPKSWQGLGWSNS